MFLIHIYKFKAKQAIEYSSFLNKQKNENLAMCGNEYLKTYNYAFLELAEKIELFKYEIYKTLSEKP